MHDDALALNTFLSGVFGYITDDGRVIPPSSGSFYHKSIKIRAIAEALERAGTIKINDEPDSCGSVWCHYIHRGATRKGLEA
jgi:hypothetical protein